ncbi:class I SAM-dependent methyltransferase [Gracilibacillus salinarum]|uniref:Class I SAM-dependent methyltransferase n=1 Tax=Gracilibacillus salinarum TaxID=2932255 RepID=A0ABY4GLF5_9BACI|nr:class I SAM-dependent methyltransferase [Gracilibacillus salinarum]UOQ84247.1 class I SAM-dependent methyltransferase [Gracilibacillus salinarum]
MQKSNWQRQDITDNYLEQVRGGIPFGAEQSRVMLQVIEHFTPNPRKIIDLGCGNGFLAALLVRTYPGSHAILIDHSKPMIEAAKRHLHPYKDRCNIYYDDLTHSLTQYGERNSIDCIVSGYAIHHLTHEKKKELYQEIYDLLAPGGIFINVEHTASATAELERLHDALFIDHLAVCNDRDRQEVATEYYERPDKEDNILERVDVQVNWLRDIGFDHADCYFKWMELAVFGGVK